MVKRKSEFRPGPAMSKKPKRKGGDPRLIARIHEYLDTQAKDKEMINISTLTDYLQKRFHEYTRRKRGPFQRYVDQMYSTVVASDDESDSFDPSDDDLSDIDIDDPAFSEKKRKRKNEENDTVQKGNGEDDDLSDNPEKYVLYPDTNSMNNMMSSIYKKTPVKVNPQKPVESPIAKNNNSDLKKTAHMNRESEKVEYFIDRGGHKVVGKDTLSGQDVEKEKTSIEQSSSVPTSLGTATAKGTNLEKDFLKFEEDDASMENEQSPEKKKKLKQKKSKLGGKIRKKNEDGEDHQVKAPEAQKSTVKFEDVGGNEENLKEICKLLVHMKHPEIYQQLGVSPPRGFLLHGPPGCGKTLLASAIAGELDLPFIKIAATEIVSGVSGDSEEKVRSLFAMATKCAPCILFIDEIDAVTQKRENASKDMERRIVAQLLTCMDDLNTNTTEHVLVIGATNRPDSLDPALRRAGRFDREICMGIPDEAARLRILKVLCRNLRLASDFDFENLAHNTPGYVGADLMALTREAAMVAVNRIFNDLQVIQLNEKAASAKLEDSLCTGTEDQKQPLSQPSADSETLNTDSSSVLQSDTSVDTLHPCSSDPVTCTSSVSDPLPAVDSVQTDNQDTGGLPMSTMVVMKHSAPPDVSDSVDTDLNTVLQWLKDTPPLTEEQLKDLYISMKDVQEALKYVQPSAKREGFATVPGVTWDDVGALHDVREELQMAILAPVKFAKEFQNLGLSRAQGILLAGPPGCGKTLLAKAVANESGINFISVKGPELLNMYVGESERGVRQVFQRARNSAPCVIFFDELDALCPRRSDGREGGSSVRVVNQLLTEMDGLEERKQVFIMAATNRPDIIDPAVLRPGRLDKTLYVGLPSSSGRLDILNTLTKNGSKPLLHPDVKLSEIAVDGRCTGYTGADLAALVREASVCALKEIISGKGRSLQEVVMVKTSHFEMALNRIRPSVSAKDQANYKSMQTNLTIS